MDISELYRKCFGCCPNGGGADDVEVDEDGNIILPPPPIQDIVVGDRVVPETFNVPVADRVWSVTKDYLDKNQWRDNGASYLGVSENNIKTVSSIFSHSLKEMAKNSTKIEGGLGVKVDGDLSDDVTISLDLDEVVTTTESHQKVEGRKTFQKMEILKEATRPNDIVNKEVFDSLVSDTFSKYVEELSISGSSGIGYDSVNGFTLDQAFLRNTVLSDDWMGTILKKIITTLVHEKMEVMYIPTVVGVYIPNTVNVAIEGKEEEEIPEEPEQP